MWADYFETNKITYAFFSASDAAALQEQADKQRRREAGEYDEDGGDDEDDEEESEDEQGSDEEVSGEEVEVEDKEEGKLSEAMERAQLEAEDEAEWSTDGEGEEETADDREDLADRRAQGEKVPAKKVAWSTVEQEVKPEEVEEDRTRVLSVLELEELFFSAAPDLNGRSCMVHLGDIANGD
jgi:large subunit GTPase 1